MTGSPTVQLSGMVITGVGADTIIGYDGVGTGGASPIGGTSVTNGAGVGTPSPRGPVGRDVGDAVVENVGAVPAEVGAAEKNSPPADDAEGCVDESEVAGAKDTTAADVAVEEGLGANGAGSGRWTESGQGMGGRKGSARVGSERGRHFYVGVRVVYLRLFFVSTFNMLLLAHINF